MKLEKFLLPPSDLEDEGARKRRKVDDSKDRKWRKAFSSRCETLGKVPGLQLFVVFFWKGRGCVWFMLT